MVTNLRVVKIAITPRSDDITVSSYPFYCITEVKEFPHLLHICYGKPQGNKENFLFLYRFFFFQTNFYAAANTQADTCS